MVVDGAHKDLASFTTFHNTHGRPRYLQRLTDLFRRHALRVGDVLAFCPLGPGQLGVRVHKAGGQVRGGGGRGGAGQGGAGQRGGARDWRGCGGHGACTPFTCA